MSKERQPAERWDKLRKKLRKRQESLQISDYALAKLTGANESTINRAMAGETIPSADLLLRILEALQIKVIMEQI